MAKPIIEADRPTSEAQITDAEILTNPVQQLVEFSKTDPNAYAKAIDSVLSFKKRAEGLLELAVAAELRLLVADERENGLEVVQ